MIYQEVRTKKEYKELIEEMLSETSKLIRRFPEIKMYQSIYNQIEDIKETIVIKQIKLSDTELQERYSLGSIAVKNFNTEEELYGRKLEDIFGAAFEYHDLP